jgi:hypothetical protein
MIVNDVAVNVRMPWRKRQKLSLRDATLAFSEKAKVSSRSGRAIREPLRFRKDYFASSWRETSLVDIEKKNKH